MGSEPTPLLSTVYVSSATELMSREQLFEILRLSQANNGKVGVTGMLLYKDGNFLQVLEGPEAATQSVLNRVETDPRHRGIIVLAKRKIKRRHFGKWSMAFANVEEIPAELNQAFSPFLQNSLLDDSFKREPDLCYKLLLSFKKRMR